jgi:isoquinoline 1-oxidoreductase beta subunit
VSKGVITHAASKRSIRYGKVAAAAAKITPPDPKTVKLKDPKTWTIAGKGLKRLDTADKLNGSKVYAIDVKLPGMLNAAIKQSPVFGGKLVSFDESKVTGMPGVKKVVKVRDNAVAVVADTWWHAKTALDALPIVWDEGPNANVSSESIAKWLAEGLDPAQPAFVGNQNGDVKAAIAGAAKTVEAVYGYPYQNHACMEPMNATARADGDNIELWAPVQSPSIAAGTVSRVAGFKPENIRNNVTLLGGGFGRRVDADYAADAALLAKAVPGTPVKVIWTREDDIKNDKFRPLVAQHLSAALDAQGNLVGLRHRMVSESIYARAAPPLFAKAGGRDQPVCEGAEHITYQVPNRVLYYLREQRGVDAGFWRAVGPGYTKFAIETLMDELAATAKKDPIQYRLALLGNQPRARAVLEEAARMADWKKPRAAGRALGIAYSDAWDAHVAEVAEISIDRKSGRIRVHDVWCAVDTGVALQPRNVAAQMESSIIYGISAALGEKVTFKDGVPLQSNFHDYPVLRMNEVPRVHVKVLVTENRPGGVGEVGLPPIAPAIANAATKLTGKRLRNLPLQQELLKA